jgi:ABC-type multidrug transport system ATPase subunit
MDQPSTTPPALLVDGLHKAFGVRTVLRGLSFEVGPGQALALRGPNGAGKSTLLACLAGLLIPDRGRIVIAGADLAREPLLARRAMRWVPQEVEVPPGVSGRELLQASADVYAAELAADAIALAELGDELDHLASSYSVGMRRRLALAAASLGRAQLWLLDEPLAGLDAAARERTIAALVQRQRRGTAFVLAAHDPDGPLVEALGAVQLELASARG